MCMRTLQQVKQILTFEPVLPQCDQCTQFWAPLASRADSAHSSGLQGTLGLTVLHPTAVSQLPSAAWGAVPAEQREAPGRQGRPQLLQLGFCKWPILEIILPCLLLSLETQRGRLSPELSTSEESVMCRVCVCVCTRTLACCWLADSQSNLSRPMAQQIRTTLAKEQDYQKSNLTSLLTSNKWLFIPQFPYLENGGDDI